MKKVLLFISMMIVSLALVACGGNDDANNESDVTGDEGMVDETEQNMTDDNDATKDEESNNEETETTDSDDMKAKMDELEYTDFELEVDYGPDKEYEAEIEQKDGNVKADLEDEINGEDLNDQEAFDKIYPLVKQLTIDKDTEKDEAIAEVLDVFDLEDDYEKLELEITFSDGVKVEFEIKR